MFKCHKDSGRLFTKLVPSHMVVSIQFSLFDEKVIGLKAMIN